jgi:hypothetical protein
VIDEWRWLSEELVRPDLPMVRGDMLRRLLCFPFLRVHSLLGKIIRMQIEADRIRPWQRFAPGLTNLHQYDGAWFLVFAVLRCEYVLLDVTLLEFYCFTSMQARDLAKICLFMTLGAVPCISYLPSSESKALYGRCFVTSMAF